MKKSLSIIMGGILIWAAAFAQAHFDSLGKLPGEWIHPPKELNSQWRFALSSGGLKTSEALFSNQWSLVYIGYAGCGSTCPLDLAKIKELYKDNPRLTQDAPFYFISADPKNDTAKTLTHYLSGLNESFTGLIAQEGKTEDVLELLESPLRTLKDNNDEILHSSHLYLIGPDLRWWKSYTFPFTLEEILADVDYMRQQSGLAAKIP